MSTPLQVRDLVELADQLRGLGVSHFRHGDFEVTFGKAALTPDPPSQRERVEGARDEAARRRDEQAASLALDLASAQ